jgi:putative DNA primase/helicase
MEGPGCRYGDGTQADARDMERLQASTSSRQAPPLAAAHLADLQASGLSIDTIAAAGIFTEFDPLQIKVLLRQSHDFAKQLGPCLVFRWHTSNGQRIPLTEYCRVKPTHPIDIWSKGKPAKYLSPRRSVNRPYFAPMPILLEALANPSAQIVITEGEKKSLKACQEGFATIGLTGVWNWARRREKDVEGRRIGERELLPELAAISWRGRPVPIIYDSDAVENRQVRAAENALAQVLSLYGADVSIVRLPSHEPGGAEA